VSRDSPSERIRDFVDKGFVMQDKLKFLHGLEANIISRLIVNNFYLIHLLVLFWTLVINIFMLATWNGSGNLQDPTPDVEAWYHPTILGLGIVHIVLSVFVVLGHFLSDPLIEFGYVRAALSSAFFGVLFFSRVNLCLVSSHSGLSQNLSSLILKKTLTTTKGERRRRTNQPKGVFFLFFDILSLLPLPFTSSDHFFSYFSALVKE